MGPGLSRSHQISGGVGSPDRQVQQQQASAAARVIALDGSLREFFPGSCSSPVSVCDVLGDGDEECRRRLFLCSSDALYLGEAVPALGAGELLRAGQVYFVLPAEMLGQPLSSAGMATLAARASGALLLAAAKDSRSRCGRRVSNKVRVVPVRAESGRAGYDDVNGKINETLNERTLGERASATATWGTPARNASMKTVVGAACPSLKRSLTTIEEDAA